MREVFGTAVASSSNCLGAESSDEPASPVTLPPGRARLATKPFPTGSIEKAITIGIVVSVPFNVGSAAPTAVTRTSIFSCRNSAAISGIRSKFPSLERHSMT